MTSVDSRNDHFLYVGSHEVRGWRYRDTYIFTPGMAAPCSKSFNCNFLLGYSSFLGWGDIEAGCYGFHQSSYRRRDTGCGAGVTAVGFWTLIAPLYIFTILPIARGAHKVVTHLAMEALLKETSGVSCGVHQMRLCNWVVVGKISEGSMTVFSLIHVV